MIAYLQPYRRSGLQPSHRGTLIFCEQRQGTVVYEDGRTTGLRHA